MPKSDTWPGGVAMETVISKESAGSCDSVISMNSNFSDDSLEGLEPEVRDSLMFLDETIVSLELEEDSGVSNDELDPSTPTLPDNKVTICLPTHSWPEDVSKYHEDPNQVMGKDHKPSMSYMVPTPLLLANGPILLRSRMSFSAADHKPKPTPQPPTIDAGIPKHANDTVGTSASHNIGDPEGDKGDILITVPAAVSASKPVAAAANTAAGNTIPSDAPELTPAKLITDALEPPTDKPVGPSELISDKQTADPAEMDSSSATNTSHAVQPISTCLADGPATDQTPTEPQAPELQSPELSMPTLLTDSSSVAGTNEDATSATPVGDATTTAQVTALAPVEAGMEFIPPPMDFMDEPAEDEDLETPASSGINLADIPAPHVPENEVSETSFPVSDIPAPNVPDTTFPASDIPAPGIPVREIPDTTFPTSDIPAPDVPAQNVPDTTFPVSDIPAPDVPPQDVSDTVFPASDIPAPLVPSSDAPTHDVPVAVFPASDIPAPIIPTPHVSPLPDAVIPPVEIPTQDNLAHDIPTPRIPTPEIPAPVIPAIDIASPEGDPKSSAVLPSQNPPKESEAAGVPPASQRGPLSYNELEKLRKKASMKKAPGMAPVVQVRGPAAPSQSSPTTEGLPGPPQDYCDPKSPPAVAPKPKKLPPNIIVKPHRSAESTAGPLIPANRVRVDMDKNKVHMEALRKLGLIKSNDSDTAPGSGPSLSPRSRRSWAPPQNPLASPGAHSSGPSTPEPPAQLAAPAQGPLVRQPGPQTHQAPAADRHSPRVSPDPSRKMVEVRLAPRQVPSDEGDAVSLRSDEDELEVPDHLPPSPPATHSNTNTPHSIDNSSAPRSHGISVEISPLSSKEDRREALRKLGLLRD